MEEKIVVKEYLDKTNGNLGLASVLIKEDLIFYLQKCKNADDKVELDFSNVTLSSNFTFLNNIFYKSSHSVFLLTSR